MQRILLSIILFSIPILTWSVGKDNLKCDYFQARLDDAALEPVERIRAVDSLIKYTYDQPYQLYERKAQLLYDEGNYSGCMDVYITLRDNSPVDSLRLRLYAEARIGVMKFTLSNFKGAFDSMYKVLETPKPDSLKYIDQYAYLFLNDFYMTTRNYPLARKYLDMGIERLKDIPESDEFSKEEKERFFGVWYRTSASQLLETDNPDQAYEMLKKSEQFPANADGVMITYITYAVIARKKGEVNMAEDYLRKALDVETNNFNKSFALVHYMKLLLDDGRAEEAIITAEEHHNLVDKIIGSPLEPDYLATMSRYYAMTGDRKKEVETLHRIIAARDSIYQATVMWEAKELAAQYEKEEKEAELSGLRAQNRQRLALVLGVGALGVLAAALAILLWRRHSKIKQDADALGKSIIHKETEHKAELRETEESLTLRNQQLSSMTMYMARLNDALDHIKDVTENDRETEKERLSTISSILKELSRQDNVWEIFRTYFESVNQSFFNNLYKAHPDLTNGEIRMCAFILMGLSNKEIAAMTNRSVRTIEVIKHNIRKKFGISEPTESYLRTLTVSPLQSSQQSISRWSY